MVDPDRVRRLLGTLAAYRDHLAALRALAGLRNRLVHLYEDVDDALVHDALADGLDDLDAYARSIAVLLER